MSPPTRSRMSSTPHLPPSGRESELARLVGAIRDVSHRGELDFARYVTLKRSSWPVATADHLCRPAISGSSECKMRKTIAHCARTCAVFSRRRTADTAHQRCRYYVGKLERSELKILLLLYAQSSCVRCDLRPAYAQHLKKYVCPQHSWCADTKLTTPPTLQLSSPARACASFFAPPV